MHMSFALKDKGGWAECISDCSAPYDLFSWVLCHLAHLPAVVKATASEASQHSLPPPHCEPVYKESGSTVCFLLEWRKAI